MRFSALVLAAALALVDTAAPAGPLTVELTPDPNNPISPQMGDRLSFHSVIRNVAPTPVDGLMAWISLVRVDPGHEQAVDLEDWSAQKAVTVARLSPGETLDTDWPMRLIQSGHYRLAVSTVGREAAALTASLFADIAVREKPVVESERVLPVALGIPASLGSLLLWLWRRQAVLRPLSA
jgi:hypothetical protein